jgi:hypothetical protein
MTNLNISQKQINNLVDDAEYLLDEAEALKYVIDSVPFDETPTDGMSIVNMLRLINHAQIDYYRPIIEQVFAENRIVRLSDFEKYSDTFEIPEEDGADVQKVLSRIIKHRAALLTVLNKIPLIDWERTLKNEYGKEISLYDFANSMIKKERELLKKIADLVLIYQNERAHQREIDKKASKRHNLGQQ